MRGVSGRGLAWAGLLFALAGCASPAVQFGRRAATLGLTATQLPGSGFSHRAWVASGTPGATTLHVYIEHDGTPWSEPDRVASDPTPRTPFALELLARDSGARLLLGRPCYYAPLNEARCTPLLWTQHRYSAEVVDSMVAALRGYLSAHPFPRLVLIGYSGGGTLAWLMAARMPEVSAVTTIAANLDVDAWARLHGYSPLEGSLNPALQPDLPAAIAQRHYSGQRDSNVPPAVLQSFARDHPAARVTEMAGFDHRCCWIEHWPQLLEGMP